MAERVEGVGLGAQVIIPTAIPELWRWLAAEFVACANAIDDGASGWEKESYDVPELRQAEVRARAIARQLLQNSEKE